LVNKHVGLLTNSSGSLRTAATFGGQGRLGDKQYLCGWRWSASQRMAARMAADGKYSASRSILTTLDVQQRSISWQTAAVRRQSASRQTTAALGKRRLSDCGGRWGMAAVGLLADSGSLGRQRRLLEDDGLQQSDSSQPLSGQWRLLADRTIRIWRLLADSGG